jgi:tetratricopeptide (TPR) repeat protein
VSPRARVRLFVAVAALAAAGIAVGATLIGRGDDNGSQTVSREPPPLELSILVRNDDEARALRAAERVYDRGNRDEARKRFQALLERDPASVEAAVGAAVAGWPDGTVTKLRRLAGRHPNSALVRLHLGLALYASGDTEAATTQWREAVRRDPDTPAALRADDLLHPNMPPGHPFFYPDFRAPASIQELPPAEQLDALAEDAANGGVRASLLYGVALQRVGQTVSARAAFARALTLAPHDLAAQVADAVGRFDKSSPAGAFSRLGPLARSHPRAAIVRFHLGLLLLWIRDVKDARIQLERAAAVDRGGTYGKEARALLSRLEAIGT